MVLSLSWKPANEVIRKKSSAIMFINKTVKLKKGLLGNLSLFADYAQKNHAASIPADIKEFQTDVTFKDWQISGDKVKQNLDQTFGPILWTQYTLTSGNYENDCSGCTDGQDEQRNGSSRTFERG
jgi:hypothetical protein